MQRQKKRKNNCSALLALILSLGAGPIFSTGAALSVGAGAGLCLTTPAHAAVPVERVADGQVVSKADLPVSGAIVFLKDSRSQSIRTYICDQQGHFHFGQLTPDTDYELWAEVNGARSKTKAISSFDSKNDYNFILKIEAAK